jgi:hypothetical protein
MDQTICKQNWLVFRFSEKMISVQGYAVVSWLNEPSVYNCDTWTSTNLSIGYECVQCMGDS